MNQRGEIGLVPIGQFIVILFMLGSYYAGGVHSAFATSFHPVFANVIGLAILGFGLFILLRPAPAQTFDNFGGFQ